MKVVAVRVAEKQTGDVLKGIGLDPEDLSYLQAEYHAVDPAPTVKHREKDEMRMVPDDTAGHAGVDNGGADPAVAAVAINFHGDGIGA